MNGSTGILLRKVIRHLFGILRSFEEWVILESNRSESAADRAAAAAASERSADR